MWGGRGVVYNENGDLVTALGQEPSDERGSPFIDIKIANWLRENKVGIWKAILLGRGEAEVRGIFM